MRKIYQKPHMEVVKMQTMQMIAVSLKDGDVSDFNDLLAPGMDNDVNWDVLPLNDDVTGF